MGIGGWLLVVALAIALGFSAGRLWPASKAKITELERDRDAAREDLQNYRQDVNVHFARTAELFDKVTADYRGLYEHLALGARQLGSIRSESVAVPLVEPELRRLARNDAAESAQEPLIAEEPPREGEPEAPFCQAEPQPDGFPSADDSSAPVTSEKGPPASPPLDSGTTTEERPVTAGAVHPPPANDEEVQPREATTGR